MSGNVATFFRHLRRYIAPSTPQLPWQRSTNSHIAQGPKLWYRKLRNKIREVSDALPAGQTMSPEEFNRSVSAFVSDRFRFFEEDVSRTKLNEDRRRVAKVDTQDSFITSVTRVLEATPLHSPQQVISTIDSSFREDKDRRMLLTVPRRKFLQQLVAEYRPKVALDIGTYVVAYSALSIAVACPNTFVVTIERSHPFHDVAHGVITSLEVHNIKPVLGDTKVYFDTRQGQSLRFDFVFMDHAPSQFLRDLDKMEKKGLLTPGAVIVTQSTTMTIEGGGPVGDSIGSEAAAFMSWMLRHPRFKVIRCPPASELHVAVYKP